MSSVGWIRPILQELTDDAGCPEVGQLPAGRIENAAEQTNGNVDSY